MTDHPATLLLWLVVSLSIAKFGPLLTVVLK